MKKIICAALIVLCLSACGGGSGPKNGSYTGSVRGYAADVVMELSFSGGKITAARVVSHDETPAYGGRAADELPGRITEAQSLGCDAISGATITSRAILKAAAEAIVNAGGDPADFGYVPEEDISAADVITFTGLPGGAEAAYTGARLMELPSVTVETQSVNSSGTVKDVTATGVLLETVLNELGVSQKDYEAITASASDGYTIEFPREVLQNRDIIIAWEVNGEPQSPRVVVPGERAMYWVKFLAELELKGAAEAFAVDTLCVLETMIAGVSDQEYKYYDSVDRAVPVSALFDKYLSAKADSVSMASIDGWEKNEKYGTVAGQFIKYTGEFAPMFIGPSLPEGMRLKETLSMQVANEIIVSAAMAMKQAGIPEGGALPLSALFETAGMTDAPSYAFEPAEGGPGAEIGREDIAKAALTLTDGRVSLVFDGDETIKELLYIKAN